MKCVYSSLAITCLALAGLAACTDAPKSEPVDNQSNVWTSQQSTVIRYTADDIKALAPGEFLHVDLNDPNAVYSISYDAVADLDRVVVVRGLDQYVLSQRLPAATSTGHQIILAPGDAAAKPANLLGGGVGPNEVTSCTCPCCLPFQGGTVCC